MNLDPGDTAWVLGSAALVLFMTPGLALFYGGMVRSKNVLAMMVQNFATIAVVSIVWAVAAYSLAFGPDAGGGLIGTLRLAGLAHPEQAVPGFDLSIPPLAFAAFQMMFAVITAALLTGAGADRMRFGGFLTFAALWTLVVYAPIAHWVFAPSGWLAQRGVLDFAGGNVVEVDSGASALALALVLGRRRGWPREAMAPHSLPLSVVGAGILWFGWFGFNAGSALASNALAAQALIDTQLAACAGLIGWVVVEKWRTGHGTTLGAASGAVSGLVAITPACGFVNSMAAILIGLLGGVVGVLAVSAKFRLGYDDSLDVVGVHGACGLVGTLLVGVFATRAVNGGIAHQGLVTGAGPYLLGVQALAVLVTIVWAFCLTWAVAQVVQRTIGLRVDEAVEIEGLDTAVHAESAYDFGNVRGGRSGY
ncbi:MAG: ammonium transporter, Amt family [Frankiaceae bacterium]|nr:ammonium transporter, Amt family [Frankiaceae bacterium]